MKNVNVVSRVMMPRDLSQTVMCKGEDGSAASLVGALPDPGVLLSATIPAKAIATSISKCRRQTEIMVGAR